MLSPCMLALSLALASPPAAASTAPPLTLADAVAQARKESPTLAGAAASAEGAELAWRMSGRLPNPAVDVRTENLGGRSSDPFGPPLDVFAVVTQPVELGGKRGVRRDAASADRDVAAIGLAGLQRQVALETVRTYVRALRARQLLESVSANREGLTTLVETIRRRVVEGYAAESDLLRFQAEAARLEAEMARTHVELDRALAELAVLIGVGMLDPAQLVEPASTPLPAGVTPAAVGAIVDQRPDIRYAEARARRAAVSVDLERLRRLPDMNVTGGYKRTSGVNTGVAGVSVAIPLFDRNGQALARTQGEARVASLDARALHTRAVVEALALLNAAETLAAQAARVELDLLGPAEGVRNAARATFREGATDVLKLVDAERVYGELRRDVLALKSDAYIAGIEARFALGQEDIP